MTLSKLITRPRPLTIAVAGGGAVLLSYLVKKYLTRKTGWQPPPVKGVDQLIKGYTIRVVRCKNTCENWVRETFDIKDDENDQFPECVIGFDAEWSMNGKVAVVQIATGKRCVVIQLLCIGEVPPLLKRLLESKSVIKLGVCVGGDARRIQKDWGVNVSSCVELSWLQHERRVFFGKGLKKMSENILFHEYSHELISVRVSNWEAVQLSKNHVSYAAADAIVGFQIAVALCGMKQSRPAPPLVDVAVHKSQDLFLFCRNAPHISESNLFTIPETPLRLADPPPGKVSTSSTGAPSAAPKGTRKQQTYFNIPVYSREGEFIALCQKKQVAKALIGDGIAVPREGEYGFQFQVEVGTTDEFHKTRIENVCVCCGTSQHINLHHVIPVTYYKRIHRLEYVHDTVLLCVSCGSQVKPKYREEMEKISAEYDIPIDGVNSRRQIRERPQFLAKQSAKAVLVNYLRSKKLYRSEKDKRKGTTEDGSVHKHKSNESDTTDIPINENDQSGDEEGNEKEEGFDEDDAPKQGTAAIKQEKAVYRMQITQLAHSYQKLTEVQKNTPVLSSDMKIPRERLTVMLQSVEAYLSVSAENITFQNLMECLNTVEPSLEFFSHGNMVVRQLDTREKEDEFLRRWRALFLSCAPMTHLSPHWRVDYIAPDSLLLRLINALDLTPFPVPILPNGTQFTYNTPYRIREKIKIAG